MHVHAERRLDQVMKIFVGTLYCGEGDYSYCVSAINAQKSVDVEHVTIRDLPEREAHNALWDAWRSRQDKFDVFVKVDADVELAHDHVLSNIAEVFKNNPRVTGMQAPLTDYYTVQDINGLNCFSPRVIFQETKDELYCDRVDVGHDIVLRRDAVPPSLRPAGLHCYHATELQSFHFGLHRALKGQKTLLRMVRLMWELKKDRNRAMVLAGEAVAHKFAATRAFNYADSELLIAFAEARRSII